MRGTTPQWLYAALDEALVEAGATASAAQRRAFIDRLISAWNLEGRSFHNCRYLAYVFEKLDELEGATSEPENLRLAAAFRGAVEEPGWEESEDRRAPAAFPSLVSLKDLEELGLGPEQRARIADLVDQLACHGPSDTDLDARLLVDADLAAFAAAPQQYREFLAHLRDEAAHMSEEDFLLARRHVVEHLLNRPRVFSTPLASQWEDAARENLEAELASIDAKLERLHAQYAPPGRLGGTADAYASDFSRRREGRAPLAFEGRGGSSAFAGGGPRDARFTQPPGLGHDPESALPPSFPPAYRPEEDGLSELVDRLEKPRSTRGASRVLRIARAQKAARLSAESAARTAQMGEDAGAGGTDLNGPVRSGDQHVSFQHDHPEEDLPRRFVSDSSQFVSDTSTLESVADLIERKARNPRGSRH